MLPNGGIAFLQAAHLMDEFSTRVDQWRDFFTLAGTAAATLIGLLFVAVTLRKDIRASPPGSVHRTMVSQNFTNLLMVVLFALYFMVPDMGRSSMGWSLLLTAAVPFVGIPRAWHRLRHDDAMTGDVVFWSFLVPALCYLATMGIAVALFLHDDTEIDWFIPVVALLLIIPTRNSWELLLESPESA
jgi:hypothetical protein